MGVESVEAGCMYFLDFFEDVDSNVKYQFCFKFTAPVLHGAGNAGVQFFPVDAVGAVYRGVDAGFFQGDLVSGYFACNS